MSYAGSGPDENSCGGDVRERISATDRDLSVAGVPKVNQDQTALLARNPYSEAVLRGVDGLGVKDQRASSSESPRNLGRKTSERGEEEGTTNMPGSVTPHPKSRARVLLGWGAGLFVSHIVSGYMQELLFAVRGYTFGFYLTLGRYLVNALLAYLYLLLFDGSKLDAPAISIHNLVAQMRWLSGVVAKEGLAGVVSAVGLGQSLQRWARRWDRYMGMPKRKTDEEHEEERSSDQDLEDSADGPHSDRSGDDIVGKEKAMQPDMIAVSIEEEVTIVRSARSGRVPIKYYLLLSFLSVMALGLSTSSLAYLNYPTKVILRTSKLVVIMLFSRFILGKKHTNSEYGMAMAMVFGLVLFTLGDYQVTAHAAEATSTSNIEEADVDSFEWKTAKGVFLLFLSLIFESININLQKKILVGYERSSPAEMVFYNALFGSLVTFAILLVNGELFSAWDFATLHPEVHYYILLFAFFSTCGVACAIMVLHNFDPMTIGIVVTGRKSITILTSFILIPKPISPHHITGGLLVFVSMFISAVWKSQEGASRPKDFAMD